MRNRYSRRPRL